MTTISKSECNATPIVLLGMTDPTYPEFMKTLVRVIGNATRRSAKALWAGVKAAAKWLKRKLDEGAEIHNRQVQMLDERYARNPYYLRGYL